VRSRAFWPKSTKTPRRSATFQVVVATSWSPIRRSTSCASAFRRSCPSEDLVEVRQRDVATTDAHPARVDDGAAPNPPSWGGDERHKQHDSDCRLPQDPRRLAKARFGLRLLSTPKRASSCLGTVGPLVPWRGQGEVAEWTKAAPC
jgi:hypothetical protein